MNNPVKAAALVLLALLATSCANAPLDSDDLYRDLGGREGIDRITGRFIAGIGEDPEIRPFFLHSNLERFHRMIGDHLCDVSGGPCDYDGDKMVETHIGMEINEAQFNRVVELLIDAMRAEDIPYPVQNRLLAKLAPLRGDIIYR